MQIKNIDRLLVFREDSQGHILTLEQIKATYGVDADGMNNYYGVNQANVDSYKATGKALNPTHRAFFNTLQASLSASADDEKTLVLGLEPAEPPDPYQFLSANTALLRQLAIDLAAQQSLALARGKRLNIAIRFASEMNDGAQIQGHQPAKYISTFVETRRIFAQFAPDILFSFSPALRADLPESLITQYWPGDEHVDIVGGTWYIGSPEQRAASITNMRAYFLHRVGTGKALALSELGGCNAKGAGNDVVLQDMLHQVEALQLVNITFKYVTLFLASKWGTDATLAFVRPAA